MNSPVGRPPVAADLIFLDRVNFSTVSQAVISCLNTNNINFNDIWAFVTDSASYMKKAYNTILHGLFPNASHVTCLAHLLQLVLEVFPDKFEELNRMCALVKRVFCQSPKRRLELRAFMMQQGLSPLMPVFAVQTRWGSWKKAVQCLEENIDILQGFIPTLPPTSKAVRDLGVLLEGNGKLLKVQASFIVEHSTDILATLTKLEETSTPTAASIFSQLEDLSMLFDYGRTADAEDWRPKTREQLKELNEDKRYTCSELFKQAMAECSTKLQAVIERHPCTELFKVLPIFDPAKVSGLKPDIKDYVQVIPALRNVSTEEWHRYIRMDKSDAVKPKVKLSSVTQTDGSYPAVLMCSAYEFYPQHIKVSWLRDGEVMTSDVTSVMEMADGDWYYQIHSELAYVPKPGEKISCMVEHASSTQPIITNWDPSLPESERNKIIIGVVVLVLGIIIAAAGLIYYRMKLTEVYLNLTIAIRTLISVLTPAQRRRLGEKKRFSVAPAPEPTPVSYPTPEPTPVSAPTPEPAPVSAPTPEPAPVSAPAPEPTPVLAPASDPAPVLAPAPELSLESASALSLLQCWVQLLSPVHCRFQLLSPLLSLFNPSSSVRSPFQCLSLDQNMVKS
ncbi:H-2 class II histocompatibility E-S beta chain-like protein [Labeo rohita]|uniref:H-2 class II histocompatibility E-S beta chain-like protein n=1 Tax=Labeo rohita TaxID=84645 RepID=A0A498LM30_LABRO|nr:H-2 class II histocompatibility E-S beta chain-like protein [Labeo rohita]